MELGAFSVSLAVKDLQASKAFYQALGFTPFAGDETQNWLMLRQGDHVIGLFQDMFEQNLMTFNPGWNQNCEETQGFTDVRQWQAHLKSQGIELEAEVDEESQGPGFISLKDPDGNPILIDQHR